MTMLLSASIYLLGEDRVDAYTSVNILVYFVSYAVTRPSVERSKAVRYLNMFLLLLFALIVAWRVYEVLVK
ncbi:MAG: hypothetical protein QW271_01705 [Sulfolobales archaeon]